MAEAPEIDFSAIPGLGHDDTELAKIDIEQYFTREELNSMGDYELMRLRKIKQNYNAMQFFGLTIAKPWFMQTKTDKAKESKRRKKYGERDAEWTPQQENPPEATPYKPSAPPVVRPKRASVGKKGESSRNEFCVPEEVLDRAIDRVQKVPFHGFSKEEVAHKVAILKEKMRKKRESIERLKNATEDTDLDLEEIRDPTCQKVVRKYAAKRLEEERRRLASERYPKRNIKRQCYSDLEVPDDDHFIYCEDCNREYDGDCPVHGPLVVVKDKEVVSGSNPDRAASTIPEGLSIKQSMIPGAGKGVWTTEPLSKGVRFGPYEGEIVEDPDRAQESGYCWEIYKDGKPSHYIDAQDESKANWMRFVNCACSEEQQSLVAFQYEGQVYYRTIRDIPANTELLVWYGQEYGTELGIAKKLQLKKDETVDSLGQKIAEIKIETSESGDLLCKECNVIYTNEVMFYQHKKIKHGAHLPLKMYLLIEKDKRERKELQISLQNKFSAIDSKEIISEFVNNPSDSCRAKTDIPQADNMSKCSICDKCFVDCVHFESHVKGHSGKLLNVNATCDKSVNSTSNVQICVSPVTERSFKCPTCGKGFNHSCHLQKHLRIHTGEKPYKCPTCGVSFNESGHLKTHLRIHTGEKPYKCPTCGDSFNRSGPLKRHLRIHTGEKPYKCPTCGVSFNESGHLKTHLRIHTGEKPYKCPTCGKSFNQSSDLKKHLRIHTGEKPYKCPTCGVSFNESGHLKTHLRIHTGEKPYKCPTCGKSFNQSSDLKKHLRIHTGEKPYKCPTCGKGFTDSSTLRKHKKTHTK